jgi:hypothetical protein
LCTRGRPGKRDLRTVRRGAAVGAALSGAREQETPPERDRIGWKLITDLTVGSRKQAVEKVQWYALCCKIEVFHKILKIRLSSRTSLAKNRSATRDLLAVFCILSRRVFWLTMTNRIAPDAGAQSWGNNLSGGS